MKDTSSNPTSPVPPELREGFPRYSLAEAMPQIVWTCFPDGSVEYFNHQWYDYTGLPKNSDIGETGMEGFHPDDVPRLQEEWRRTLRQGSDFELEFRIRNAAGLYRWFLGRGVGVRDEGGNILRWVGTSTDIDDQKHALENLQFLANASELLSSSLDYEKTLTRIADLAVPQIADWCTVDIVGENGELQRLAVSHVNPEKIKWAIEIEKKYPTDRNAPTGVPHVIRTGKSEFYPDIPDELLVKGAIDKEHLRLMREIGFTSAMTVPLVARGLGLGAISFITAESKRKYTEADLAFAEDLGRRAATAIDNSWLYHKSQEEVVEHKRTMEALRDSEERYRIVAETATDGIVTIRQDSKILFANSATSRIFGYSIEEMLSREITMLMPEFLREVHKKAIGRYVETGKKHISWEGVELPGLHKDGHEIPIELSFGEFVKEGRHIFTGIIRDVTERKRADEEVRRMRDNAIDLAKQAETAKEQAEAANQAKDRFLAVLSHELRTPLTPVLATVQALIEDSGNPDSGVAPQVQPWLDIIQRNVEIEARLIDDLLDLTRIAKGKFHLNLETVDVHEVLMHVVEMYRSEMGAKLQQLEFSLRATKHCIKADSARLRQVFWNLIKNSVKFTPDEGRIKVSTSNLTSAEGETLVRIEIADTGIGIEPEILPRLFNAFEQGEQTITRHYGGLGLGLAISKSLIEMVHGTVTATSEGKDRGATFIVEVPIDEGIPAVQPTNGQQLPKAKRKDNAQERAGKTILLIDDHPDTNSAIKVLLERRGFKVISAISAKNALEVATKEGFDFIVSDIGLPDQSGLELLPQLLKIRPVKAVALSGFGTEEDIERSKNAGFDAHLIKPVNLNKLLETIESLLFP